MVNDLEWERRERNDNKWKRHAHVYTCSVPEWLKDMQTQRPRLVNINTKNLYDPKVWGLPGNCDIQADMQDEDEN